MGRLKRGGYLIEWWIGDHDPKHVHVYEDGKDVAKIKVPDLLVLQGKMSKKLRKILEGLIKDGEL
ncbi:MAG: DUF4160 domain-containing protein [Deltaproteobacteria bacterium]|nr:MAG: DUF4160 domain-containing protein [Deltaproteobacteria bacterium]